eukprot:GHRR01019349.1.p2 GENE.GHRR01019349.1~~GHRR01019349.1.p2  ORF type:complete len:100 (+),score=17.95 GHRR01019349.1:951-1250(+)
MKPPTALYCRNVRATTNSIIALHKKHPMHKQLHLHHQLSLCNTQGQTTGAHTPKPPQPSRLDAPITRCPTSSALTLVSSLVAPQQQPSNSSLQQANCKQ